MEILLDLSLQEMQEKLSEISLKKYQVKQVYDWLNLGMSFEEMTNVSKQNRLILASKYIDIPVVIFKKYVSKDKTQKLLYQLSDGNLIEGVLMSYKYGNTLCVSTQVGCRMGCSFCASTKNGLIRNLTAGEILGQIIVVNRMLGGVKGERAVTNVVLMGSGEPLDNFDNVIQFLRLANCSEGLNISCRNISLSTCGLVPKMKELATLSLPVNLTISLHSPVQQEREKLMPIAKKYNLKEVIEAAKNYFEVTGRRVIFEYTLVKGINDKKEDAARLAQLLKGFSTHVNLIMLNPVQDTNLQATSRLDGEKFLKMLTDMSVSATIRRQMGVDIQGACGQLRQRYLNESDES